jgi:uncharacterized membrane protein YphA (DoxX/SURF4 family)/predicted enzyme related to lactoylglutathione lyase
MPITPTPTPGAMLLTPTRHLSAAVHRLFTARLVHRIALLGLCGAYLQGGIDKAADFPAAIAEMPHFGLAPAAPLALATIIFEIGASLLVLTGLLRWAGALALAGFTLFATFVANRFWELAPPERIASANGFFEHLGLVGGFLLVAWYDLKHGGSPVLEESDHQLNTEEFAMRIKHLVLASIMSIGAMVAVGGVVAVELAWALPAAAQSAAADKPQFANGPQNDTTHVYVPVEDFDRFVSSIVATFGGSTSQKGVFQVTPTPSQTMSQLVFTPVGTFSVFGFTTPIPYPFGAERNGYYVTDMDAAVQAARAHGADVPVAIFPDPIGRDAVIRWPGGVNMQLYWHINPPNYGALQSVPENRVYLSPDRADAFVRAFTGFAHGRIVADNARAPGVEIGRPNGTYRQIRIESRFGKVTVIVTDGHLPYPYGREVTGYEVSSLGDTLSKARAAGATILVESFRSSDRESAMVQFPGGYIAEVHSTLTR